MDIIIGVDIGTSATKAVAFHSEGHVLAHEQVDYELMTPQPGWFEQDPAVLFDAVVNAIAQLVVKVKGNGGRGEHIAIGFSSAMHGLIAMDAHDQPLTNCIIWADTRSASFAAELKRTDKGLDNYLKTGTPIHAMSPLCKLCWLQTEMPAIFEAARKFISIKEYVFYRLFGRYVVDESIASATGLFDIHAFQWYRPALELAGIDATQLSEPVPITHTLSGLPAQLASEMGIPEDTPFVVGGSDGCLANLGAGAVHPGVAAVTIGTSGAIRMVAQTPQTDKKARTFCYVLTKRLFVVGGAVNSGGMVFRWYRDTFGGEGQAGSGGYQQLIAEASTVATGADGLLFLPYLAGERAPYWNANAKGLFFGVQLHHTKAHFTRAVLEGIVYGLYSVGTALEELASPIKVIHANGGFARAPFWVQLLADVFNKRVVVSEEGVQDAAKGACMVVLKALGKTSGFDMVGNQSANAVYEPDTHAHRRYMESFELFGRLYERLKDEF
ncbi:gluconokinase [Parapedobacter sp. 10938]|uniref:gluconokinase n=1 Tax=Parapedobacter flavus TaxID=3110225 RepID=UPI002DB6B538|nr:gluconokinase [Parapedobacter sp. 10938]MEC3878648.1 gluconokinase [Parapedobacter sp. 10938]